MTSLHYLIGQIDLESGGFVGFISMPKHDRLWIRIPMTWDITKARAFPSRKVAQMYLDRVHGFYSVSTYNGRPTRFVFVPAITTAVTLEVEL